jgi:hypothetical protein
MESGMLFLKSDNVGVFQKSDMNPRCECNYQEIGCYFMRKGSFFKALCRLWRMGSEFGYPALIQLDYNRGNFGILQFQSMTCPWRDSR